KPGHSSRGRRPPPRRPRPRSAGRSRAAVTLRRRKIRRDPCRAGGRHRKEAYLSRLAPIGLAVLACLLVLLGAWGAALRGEAYPALASIQMAVDSAGPGQLFWPGSNGYSEPGSERFGLEHGEGVREYLV